MATKHTIGWIGLGRMGEQVADRLINSELGSTH
jgi:3-hydroxyisobutyrate dehydrogenase-like beta-hydroxyacid dehydrogenase